MNDEPPFQKAIEFTLKHEGGYVNDPNDSGGETKYGISKRSYPNLDIANLTLDEAKGIYYKDYWRSAKCDLLDERFGILLFDFAVNAGQSIAIKEMQKALKVVADGIIGEQTIQATQQASDDEVVNYLSNRARYYFNLGNPRYLQGWLNRTFYLAQYI